ncbi:NADPH:quinone reductase [Lutimaribacter sp. EGI FJ00015]|uniref:NADPH:quinone reductase n=1 Tax=Lutimaribacter degradans TaxID=2945989 RepID=A0ACC6A0E3_9RHOB|nr:NADPH:quinone reductase [Lutimaribacter sp. EGI FJ00013]MCM2563890.1 NADPH:quinone reductase [Lutimaribacter sp. EGI FJ00013]MCO0614057.1 NADPH:quinone reductase [Lutimaribacter sp. EGI FJ00015]MCO0636195.1 NADPH:quinone reductase [Lutimaribacter sp. EGI FJ00014]
MKAITYSEFGPAAQVLALHELPTPDPAPGEVLVRLSHSGANPSDVKARAGSRPGVTKPPFPQVIPHSDGAGEIVAVGEGVDASRVGQPVWIWNGQWQRPFGTATEHIALPADQAVPRPDWISAETGATLGIPGLTAAHAVLGGGDVAGKTLLVSGGGGAVGHNAVQLAAWAGARVIATCSPRDKARVRAAGAQEVLEYRDPDLGGKLLELTGGHGIDRAVETEFGMNAAMLGEAMAPNGTVAAYGSALDMTPTLPFGAYLFKAISIDILLIYLLPDGPRQAAIDALHRAIGEGALSPAIHAAFPLADCVGAHECIEAGNRAGAVLLTI